MLNEANDKLDRSILKVREGRETEQELNKQDKQELASNTCTQCGNDFTIANPCWNDDGVFNVRGMDLHVNGICQNCYAPKRAKQFHPTAQHERGE